MAAIAGPNTLTLPRRSKCSPTVNVDRLNLRAGRPDPPGPVSDPGYEREHLVEQTLNRKTLHGRTYYLVRWQGHTSRLAASSAASQAGRGVDARRAAAQQKRSLTGRPRC